MNIKPFKLERYFAKYEFSAKYLLCSSDCDGLAQKELLEWADSETKELWNSLKLGYTESLGNPLLRKEVAKLYETITHENVLITTPEEGIFIAFNTMLRSGDHVVCTFPGYQSLYQIAQSIGCEVTKWNPEEQNGWNFNINQLKKIVKANTKLIIINFPHNPTGYLPSNEELLQIVNFAKENNISIFSDEMYRFLEYNQDDRLDSVSDLYDNSVSLFGMSKTFGMAGVRIGWLVTKNKSLYSKMSEFKDYTTICSSAPSEILSIIALRNKDKIIMRHLKRIERNLQLLDVFFNKFSNIFSWSKPKAGTICFPKLLINKSAYEFCEQVIKDTGIMLLPSTVYDYDDKHIRIGFGRENMPEVLSKLEEYLSK
ncbi:aminotransferase class I/II-fold pyridoxal phosphate-dependent enzyme [Candidatus Gottesmanbacteria bacterium]|nr:aminotransferase class I/II-fold pyridoxal phosphate-dependent enzyme [Candidatus Gottesmanbacteria bacterium]